MGTLAANDRLTPKFTAYPGQTVFAVDFPPIRVGANYQGLYVAITAGETTTHHDHTAFAVENPTSSGFRARLLTPLAGGEIVQFYGRLSGSRPQAYTPGGAIATEAMELDATRLAAVDQELRRDLERAWLLPIGDAPPAMPGAAVRKGKLAGWDSVTGDWATFDPSYATAVQGSQLAPIYFADAFLPIDEGGLFKLDFMASITPYMQRAATGLKLSRNLSPDGDFLDEQVLSFTIYPRNRYDANSRYFIDPYDTSKDDTYRYEMLNLYQRVTDFSLPIHRPRFYPTGVDGGTGAITGLTFDEATNYGLYEAGQTVHLRLEAAPASTTPLEGTVGVKPDGLGGYEIDWTTVDVTDWGSGYPSDLSRMYGYIEPHPGAPQDTAGETHTVRLNPTAGRTGSTLAYHTDVVCIERKREDLIDPFTTSAGSKVINVYWPDHGAATGWIFEPGLHEEAGSGFKADGTYAITKVDDDNFTIVNSRRATASVADFGGSVRCSYGDFRQALLYGGFLLDASDPDNPRTMFNISLPASFAAGGNKPALDIDDISITYYGTNLQVRDVTRFSGISDPTLWLNSQDYHATPNWSGQIAFGMKNSAGGSLFGTWLRQFVWDATAGAEDVSLSVKTYQAGVQADACVFRAGVHAPTRTDPGRNNLRFEQIHADGFYGGGTVLMTGRKAGWGVPTGTLARATFAAYAAPAISAGYVQAEVQGIADHVQILSRTLAGLITDLHATSAGALRLLAA